MRRYAILITVFSIIVSCLTLYFILDHEVVPGECEVETYDLSRYYDPEDGILHTEYVRIFADDSVECTVYTGDLSSSDRSNMIVPPEEPTKFVYFEKTLSAPVYVEIVSIEFCHKLSGKTAGYGSITIFHLPDDANALAYGGETPVHYQDAE